MTVLSRPASTQAEFDEALAIVRERGCELRHAHPSLKVNAQIVLAAVTSDPWALEYADDDLRADPTIVLVAVKRCGFALKYADESVQGDRQVVLAAVKQVGTAVQFATLALRRDRDVAIAAVTNTDFALNWVHDDLKGDPEVVQRAVRNNPASLFFASEAMRRDTKCLVLSIYSAGPDFLLQDRLTEDHRLRAVAEIGRTEASLLDWRGLATFLMGMCRVRDDGDGGGGGGGGKRRNSKQCALGLLHVGGAVFARRIGTYLGTPGRFEGAPDLGVVAVYREVVTTTPPWARFAWTKASLRAFRLACRDPALATPGDADVSDDEAEL